MDRKWFFNFRNAAITVLGLILTIAFYIRYGDTIKPIVFSGVVLCSSILYSVLFYDRGTYSPSVHNAYGYNGSKLDSIDSVVSEIYKSLKSIKSKSKDEEKFLLVAKFIEEIDEFEDAIPKLVEDYKEGMKFVGKQPILNGEIKKIEMKISSTKGVARETYEKTLKEKLSALEEISEIQTFLDETESKLHYILSTLQKTEAIMQASELGDALSDEDMNDLNTHMESFSEGLKSVIESMKL